MYILCLYVIVLVSRDWGLFSFCFPVHYSEIRQDQQGNGLYVIFSLFIPFLFYLKQFKCISSAFEDITKDCFTFFSWQAKYPVHDYLINHITT